MNSNDTPKVQSGPDHKTNKLLGAMVKKTIQFAAPADDGRPKLQRARGADYSKPLCRHSGQLHMDRDTELVQCGQCKGQMTAWKALELIVSRWETMFTLVEEYRAARVWQATYREKLSKEQQVRELRRTLQWVEIPEEGDEPARSTWLRVREAIGKEPYAMFRRGSAKRTVQYCIVGESGGWVDAELLIERATRCTATPGGAE